MPGEPLTGDGVTQGIVRIGDTVRRLLRPFSLTVQAYLAHLRDAGFAGVTLPLGVDEQGREVMSFVSGDVPRNPLPPPRDSARWKATRGPARNRASGRRWSTAATSGTCSGYTTIGSS